MNDYAWVSDKTLKPCPFCGKKDTYCSIESTNITCGDKPVIDAIIHCHFCGSMVHYREVDKDLAVAMAKMLWNNRAGDEE